MLNAVLALFLSFFKIGCVGYGGGPSMVPLIKNEVVNIREWMTLVDFTDILAIGNVLPGPVATKLSTVIGYEIAGPCGAVAATVAIILPGALLLILLLNSLDRVKDNPKIKSMLCGLRPVVVAMLAYAAYDMSFGSLVSLWAWIIASVTFILMISTKIHPALLIVAGAVTGVALGL